MFASLYLCVYFLFLYLAQGIVQSGGLPNPGIHGIAQSGGLPNPGIQGIAQSGGLPNPGIHGVAL
jgi:hypothetical protein